MAKKFSFSNLYGDHVNLYHSKTLKNMSSLYLALEIGNRSSYREVRVMGSRYREKMLDGTRKIVRIKVMFEL